jgi:hypothetical protein
MLALTRPKRISKIEERLIAEMVDKLFVQTDHRHLSNSRDIFVSQQKQIAQKNKAES